MRSTRLLSARLALLLTVPVAVASAAADGDGIDKIRTAAQLPIEILAQLPATAAEVGLDYAPRLVQVHAPTREARNRVVKSGLDVTEHAGDDFIEVVFNTLAEEEHAAALGFTWQVVTPDLIALEHDRIMADAALFQSVQATDLPSTRTTYRVLQDYYDDIDQIVADNPDLAKRISVGESVEGRDLVGIELGVSVNDPEDGRPVFLMFGNHHAREWPSAEAPMEFAFDLVNAFNLGDARAVDLLDRVRVVIVPVSNPDGFDASRTAGDLIDFRSLDGGDTVSVLATPGNAYKRKNCRVVDGVEQPAGTCVLYPSPGGTGVGIDLNRNYGALWGGPGANGAAPSIPDPDDLDIYAPTGFLSPLYRGPAPFSEPETQAIRDLISTRQVTMLITNHTFSNLLLRPVGVEPSTIGPDDLPVGFAPDECFLQEDGFDNGMQALGERMTAQTGYSNQFGWELYDTTGTTEDYSYNATGGYGYTFEIGPNEFHPPYEEFIAEYTGETEAAQMMNPVTAPDRTTAAGRDCPGTKLTTTTFGGGLSEAFWIAVENAANAATHSTLVGEAPAGAVLSVERTGTFPLWDKTEVEDTVRTEMVAPGGAFAYHVNPSTRPFVDSRPYTESGSVDLTVDEVSREDVSGAVLPPALGSEDIPIDVPAGIDALVVDLTHMLPSDDYDIELYSPEGLLLDDSGEVPGADEHVQYIQPNGIPAGQYVLRILNFAALGEYTATITLGTVPDTDFGPELVFSPRTTESWTARCFIDGEEVANGLVTVDRGETADLGDFCASGFGVDPVGQPDDTPATGGGLALLALPLIAAALLAASRQRRAQRT